VPVNSCGEWIDFNGGTVFANGVGTIRTVQDNRQRNGPGTCIKSTQFRGGMSQISHMTCACHTDTFGPIMFARLEQ